MSDKKDYIIEINDLSVEYSADYGAVHAVNGLNLQLERGHTLGLVGETGAGKTTTALSIMNLIPVPPARVTGGQILFNGRNVFDMSPKELRDIRGKHIAMIFQDPMTSLNPVLTVGDQIAEVIKLHDEVSNAEAVVRAQEMLSLVGIPPERFYEYPHQFSGGMKQRVVIAMALACDPELLLADEPTTALDVTIQAQVLELMRDLRKQFNTSTILITHDLGVVAEMCDDVAIMYAGEVVEMGSADDIFNHTKHPYTKGLFGSLPDLDTDSDRLHPIEGLMPDPTNLPEGCCFSPRCPNKCELCEKCKPDITAVGPGHIVRCHLFSESKED